MQKTSITDLNHLLGNIDLYLLDQILKGRFESQHKILDAGCGEGRNIVYFIRNNYQVFGIDKNGESIQRLKYQVKSINKNYPLTRFMNGKVEEMSYPTNEFNAIISSAVLHFAESETHFFTMIKELTRVLKPGGILFIRMACEIGMEDQMKSMGNGTYFLPDGSIRFLLTKALLQQMMENYSYEFIEPFKAVVVDNQRSMSTLVLRKL